MATPECADQETLDQFLAGDLPSPSRRRLERHIDSCPRCREALVDRLHPWSLSRAVGRNAATPPAPHPPARKAQTSRYLVLDESVPDARLRTAYDTLLDRRVTLAFLTAPGAPPGPLAEALGRAAALARLSHPNLPAVHDVDTLDGAPYLAMELVDGVSVTEWRQAEPRSARQIARVMAGAARGLAAAHRAGIVHGDVRPDNILVAEQRVVVTGFVASAAADPGGPRPYLAPERRQGAPPDQRDDVHAFCATLLDVVRGAPASAPLPSLSRAAVRLERLARRGLDPGQRWPSLDDLGDELLSDPAARWRNIALGGAAVAAVALAFWSGASRRANPEQVCRAGAATIDGAWNDGRRAELRRRFEAGGATASWSGLERRLEGYVESWRRMYGDVCGATFGRRVQTGQVFDLRIQCLEARRAVLESFVVALGSATPAQIVRAADAVMPDVSDCGIEGRLETKPLPADPRARAQIGDIDRLVARSLAEENLGNLQPARTLATQAVQAARKAAYGPVLASALVRLGKITEEIGGSGQQANDFAEATLLLEEAYRVAEEAHEDHQRLSAAGELVVLQTRLQHYADGDRWAGLAEALLSRLGNSPAEGAELANSIGRLRYYEVRPAESAAQFEKAFAFAQKIVPPDPRRQAIAQEGMCMAKTKPAEMVAACRLALQMAQAAYGAEHPALATFYANLADTLGLQAPTHKEACAMFRKVAAMEERNLDPSHPSAMAVTVKLAQCLHEEGEVAEARRLYEQAIARKPNPWDLGFAEISYGALLQSYDPDLRNSERAFRHALASLQQVVPPSDDMVLFSRMDLARTLTLEGRMAEAHAVLDEAHQAAAKAGVMTTTSADLHTTEGVLLLRERRFEAAASAFAEALRQHEQAGSREWDRSYPLIGLGMALFRLHRIDEAIRNLEQAWSWRPLVGSAPEQATDLRFTLAQALAAVGRDQARACALVREAIAVERLYPAGRRRIPETERWAATHRCAQP